MDLATIFIVDENLLTRIAQEKYFEQDKRFKVIGSYNNAGACLEEVDKKNPDIVLIDIDLPDIDGCMAVKKIIEKQPKTKVIILTSQKEKEKFLASLICGARGYVLKNNYDIDLKQIIQIVLKGELWMDKEVATLAFSSFQDLKMETIEDLDKKESLRNNLTLRELEVLKLMIEGKTNSQIASEIIVSTNTAKAHVGSILNKLSAKDRVQAVVKAVRANIF